VTIATPSRRAACGRPFAATCGLVEPWRCAMHGAATHIAALTLARESGLLDEKDFQLRVALAIRRHGGGSPIVTKEAPRA
jgi:hypothetical protein